MAYQFLYRTNKMFDEELIDYLTNLLNSDKKLSKEQKQQTKEAVKEMISYLTNDESKDILWDRIEIPESKEYISKELTIEEAIKDFEYQNFDLWDVDEEVEIVTRNGSKTNEREMINISNTSLSCYI